MDYDSLIAQIKEYAKRTDEFFIDQIPNFIDQAVNRIYSEAKSIGFEKVTRGTLLLGDTTLEKPADWKETISFTLIDSAESNSKTNILEPRSLEFCTTYWNYPTNQSTPKYYANYLGYNSFLIVPTPNFPFNFELVYLSLPLFNKSNQTNFLTERYPSLLLYACMLETAPFLKNDQRIPVFESLYKRALQSINSDTKKMYTDRSSKRDQT